MSAALVAATFGFALPHLASYHSVWATIIAMTWLEALVVAAAAAGSMVLAWVAICAVLPSVRLRQAAVVNLGSSAVANALPAGGALSMGVSWAMLSGWGVSTADYVLYTLVSGIWNVFARLSLPALALAVLLTAGRPSAGLLAGAAAALVALVVVVAALGLLLRSEALALGAGRGLQRAVTFGCRLSRRRPPGHVAVSVLDFRSRTARLLKARGWRITAATAGCHLSLWLLLLACLRGAGLSQAEVPWQESLEAFAIIRLLTLVPITPGGLGITELGLVSILAAGSGHGVTVRVTAAVLLYRALTYLLPIPLGAAACLAWRHAPVLLGPTRRVPAPLRVLAAGRGRAPAVSAAMLAAPALIVNMPPAK